MSESALKALSDMASDAHVRIQAAHEHINPVVEVRRGMRDSGIPADVMTIDCLRTRRRITLILHDEQPGTLLYQFITIEEEVGEEFQSMPLSGMDTQKLFQWIEGYFG
jgi:hypothetical protein